MGQRLSFGPKKSDLLAGGRIFGGPSATRTRDQLVKSQLLYRLS